MICLCSPNSPTFLLFMFNECMRMTDEMTVYYTSGKMRIVFLKMKQFAIMFLANRECKHWVYYQFSRLCIFIPSTIQEVE